MIYVGTCGYAYRDWLGSFYPATIKSREMLGYYSQQFAAVEIDTSYYGVPSVRTVENMVERTPAEFRFSFKVPQTLTHASTGAVHADAAAFSEAMTPALHARKLAAVLVQFPNSFHPGWKEESYLARVADALRPLPLVAEFRHRAWQCPHTVALLRELEIGWCNVDVPAYERLPAPSSDAVGGVGYVRFHGRNAAAWWTGDNLTRYDYLYPPEELVPWIDRVVEIDGQTRETFAFFNNHARGNAARNAEMLAAMLQERLGGNSRALARVRRRLPAQPELPLE